jgi:hypothetical protein
MHHTEKAILETEHLVLINYTVILPYKHYTCSTSICVAAVNAKTLSIALFVPSVDGV